MNPNDIPTYDPVAVMPLRAELNLVGFKDTDHVETVDEAIASPGTTLLMVNSVCGCSAGSARPGVCASLQNTTIPDHLITVFAGQDKTALEHIRSKYLGAFQPSSPFIALFKDGQPILSLQRTDIQEMDAEAVAGTLARAFNDQCSAQGPSIAKEDYDKMEHTIACGSTFAKFQG
jgi:putative YphP/YqiW family bacilliredoxin